MSEHPKGYCPVFGNYPAEYNRAVHGPYYPWVNYNKTQGKHFSEVKLGELGGWIAQRNKTPAAIIAAASRVGHKWAHYWIGTRMGSPTKGIFQILVMASTASLLASYGVYRAHRNHKYHW